MRKRDTWLKDMIWNEAKLLWPSCCGHALAPSSFMIVCTHPTAAAGHTTLTSQCQDGHCQQSVNNFEYPPPECAPKHRVSCDFHVTAMKLPSDTM